MIAIVDTNVAVVANQRAPQASSDCVRWCVQRLRTLQRTGCVVIDDGWRILNEYKDNLREQGQPGVGDAFLRWLLRNRSNPRFCCQVHITPGAASATATDFAEFPQDPALAAFDPSDRKFVAVAVAHPEHPPVLNAVDSDWWDHREALAQHGVQVEFLCPDAPFMQGG